MSWELQNNLDSKKEIRKVYGDTLESMIQEGKDIMVCDSDLVGSSGAGKIYEKYKMCIRDRMCSMWKHCGSCKRCRCTDYVLWKANGRIKGKYN